MKTAIRTTAETAASRAARHAVRVERLAVRRGLTNGPRNAASM